MKTVLFYNIASFLILASCVQASLYPTRPTKNTVYLAGKAAKVTWIEGGRKPLLAKMGKVQIDLYTGHDVSAFIYFWCIGAGRGVGEAHWFRQGNSFE